MHDTAIEVRNLEVSFGETKVLQNVSFDIEKGKFVGIFGPSGSGKTTLLRSLAGLVHGHQYWSDRFFSWPMLGNSMRWLGSRPASVDVKGRIKLNGESVVGKPAYDYPVAYLSQGLGLMSELDVEQNIALGGKARELDSPALYRPKVERVARQVNLPLHLLRYDSVDKLSGGERQRVALAYALYAAKHLLFLDEPLSNLDAYLRDAFRLEIRRLHISNKLTTMYITHDPMDVRTLFDVVMVMDKGRVIQVGSPSEVYHRPVSLVAAQMFGSLVSLPSQSTEVECYARHNDVLVSETARNIKRADWKVVDCHANLDGGFSTIVSNGTSTLYGLSHKFIESGSSATYSVAPDKILCFSAQTKQSVKT